MAETATPTATPAPSGTTSEPGSGTAPASPPTPAAEPKQPASADQARRQARDAIASRVREREQATQETPKEGETPAGEKPTETPASEQPTGDQPTGAQPAGEPGEQPDETPAAAVKVDIPADHPIANGKAGSITVASEEEARVVRGLVNSTGVRVRENETLRRRAQEAEREAMQVKQKLARLETSIDVRTEWEGTPEYAQVRDRYNAIKEEHGQAEADAYLRGKTAEIEKRATEKYRSREQELQAEVDARESETFARDAYMGLESLPSIIREQQNFSNWFQSALRSFEAQLAAGDVVDEMGQPIRPSDPDKVPKLHKAFRSHFEAYIVSRPEVRKAYADAKQRQQAQEKAAAEKATAEEERINKIVDERVKEALRSQGRVAPPHPLGQIPSAARHVDSSGSGAEAPASASLGSADQVRRAARNAVQERARQRGGGT